MFKEYELEHKSPKLPSVMLVAAEHMWRSVAVLGWAVLCCAGLGDEIG